MIDFELQLKKITPYFEIKIISNNASINLGLLNYEEQEEFANVLEQAIIELDCETDRELLLQTKIEDMQKEIEELKDELSLFKQANLKL